MENEIRYLLIEKGAIITAIILCVSMVVISLGAIAEKWREER